MRKCSCPRAVPAGGASLVAPSNPVHDANYLGRYLLTQVGTLSTKVGTTTVVLDRRSQEYLCPGWLESALVSTVRFVD